MGRPAWKKNKCTGWDGKSKGKIKYVTMEEAVHDADAMNRVSLYDKQFQVYFCKACWCWHIGRSNHRALPSYLLELGDETNPPAGG